MSFGLLNGANSESRSRLGAKVNRSGFVGARTKGTQLVMFLMRGIVVLTAILKFAQVQKSNGDALLPKELEVEM